MSPPDEADREALRQQILVRALLGDARPGVVAGWLRDGPQRATRGLQAYRANAAALAGRALAVAFPTVAQLLGGDAMAGLARAHWHAEPPRWGDVAMWGSGLPAFIAADPQLAGEPYLADVARLDWAVHQAGQAADVMSNAPPSGLARLATDDPSALWLQFAPGTTLVSSPHPIVTIWQAHQPAGGDGTDVAADALAGVDADADAEPGARFAAVRAAFAAGTGEHARVSRDGWRVAVHAVPPGEARFLHSLLDGEALGVALQAAGADFQIEPWLIDSLSKGRVAAVLGQAPGARHTSSHTPDTRHTPPSHKDTP